METNKHTDFSPSGFSRRFHCPASYLLEKGKPDVSSAFADEGTRIHDEVAKIVRGELNEVDADPLAQRCFTRFSGIVEVMGENPSVYIEKHLSATVGGLENSGTLDCLVINGENAVLVDWKTGYEKIDFPAVNWQMKWYITFIFENFPAVQGIKAIVFNPRIWQDESHYFNRTDLDTVKSELAEVIRQCLSGSPEPTCGAWCNYCKGKAECPAVKNALQRLESALPLSSMGDGDLTALYDKITAVKGVIDNITDEMKRRIAVNGSCGDYVIRTVSGATDITDNDEMKSALAGVLSEKEIESAAKYSFTALVDAFYNRQKATGAKVTKSSAKADMLDRLQECIKKRPDQERIAKR